MCSTHLDLQLQHALLEVLRQIPRVVWVQVEVAADAVLQAAVLAASALHHPAGKKGGKQVAAMCGGVSRRASAGEGVLTECNSA